MGTILILYEESGVFTNLYKNAGYNVIQKDFLIDGEDIRLMKEIKGHEIIGILCFPPCDHLAGAGARHWQNKGESKLLEGLSTVDVCFRFLHLYQPKFWFIENPVGRLVQYIGKPKYYFHPYEYAGYIEDWKSEAYMKKTCLWGNFNIPEKKQVELIYKPTATGQNSWSNQVGGKSEKTKRFRSKTPEGFAKAFVESNK